MLRAEASRSGTTTARTLHSAKHHNGRNRHTKLAACQSPLPLPLLLPPLPLLLSLLLWWLLLLRPLLLPPLLLPPLLLLPCVDDGEADILDCAHCPSLSGPNRLRFANHERSGADRSC